MDPVPLSKSPLSKVFEKSPSLKDRLQQAVAKKTGQVVPNVEVNSTNPPPDLSSRLQALVGKHERGNGLEGARKLAPQTSLVNETLAHDLGGQQGNGAEDIRSEVAKLSVKDYDELARRLIEETEMMRNVGRESAHGLAADYNELARRFIEETERMRNVGRESAHGLAADLNFPAEEEASQKERDDVGKGRHDVVAEKQKGAPKNGSKAHVVDLSSDSSGEEEGSVFDAHERKRQMSAADVSSQGQKRQLPEWALPGERLAKRATPETAFGSQGEQSGHQRPSFVEETAKDQELRKFPPNWYVKRSTSSPALAQQWPAAKPGSLEALRGRQLAPPTQAWASEGGFGRSFSDFDRDAAKRALAGPLREAALAHSGSQESLQVQYQQQLVQHQRQQQEHFQRRILPPTMHTHTLAAGPSAPKDNDVALRGVLEGMAVTGPSEESNAPEGSMTVPLLKHQRLALSWMKKRESGTISNQPVGGILADDQGLGKTITTIALIMSNKAPMRLDPKFLPSAGLESPAPAETVNLDDYKEVLVTEEDDGDDELVEIPPENVQLRLEYRPGNVSQPRAGGELSDEVSMGWRGDTFQHGASSKGRESPASVGGFVQDVNWGGFDPSGFVAEAEAQTELGGLRLHNGVLENASAGFPFHANGAALVEETKRKPRVGVKKEEEPEDASGGVARDLTGKRGRPPAGTLVVCPTSVLRQWANEVRDKVAPEEKLKLLVYHGPSRTKDPYELASYDVVLTTYAIVSMEVPKQPLPEGEAKEKPPRSKGKKKASKLSREDEGLVAPGSGPLARVAWFRVVLDEAQSIKNARTQAARAAWSLRAKRRWCLSGTPIQNTIDDLYSYFRFLRFAPYDVFKSFRSLIREPIARNPGVGYRRLQVILNMIMMRRTKATVIEGRPIIDLPPRLVSLSQADFTAEERGFYDALERDSRQKFNAFRSAGTLNKNYVNILWMLLRLRQACNHWSLVKGLEEGDHHESKEAELVAKKLHPELRAALLAAAESMQSPCGLCQDAPEEAVVTKCCHVFCRQCIAEQVNNTDNLEAYACPVCKASVTAKDVFSPASLRKVERGPESQAHFAAADGLPAVRSSSKIDQMMRILLELPKRRVRVSPDTGEIVGDNAGPVPEGGSPEVDGTVETTEKAIIFSQWTSMLDLLEGPLQGCGIEYRRLDGTMTVPARDRAISDFTRKPKVTVMIMSLKAASLGLNLVAASHVLLLDVWWNPTTEDQAIDRAHRIGQTRTVNVSRLAVRATIEDRILALQEKKREIVASAFGEQEGGGTSRLSMEDLAFLFRSDAR